MGTGWYSDVGDTGVGMRCVSWFLVLRLGVKVVVAVRMAWMMDLSRWMTVFRVRCI